jgi:uncharacterized cupredoxin-like copper-binding protein
LTNVQFCRRFAPIATAIGLIVAMPVALLGAAAPVSGQTMAPHPAHIHTGSCPTPGDVVFPLSDVSAAGTAAGTPMASSAPVGQANNLPVETSVTTVAAGLGSLADGNHAIVIHESAANIGHYLVCGNIGGMMVGPSDLAVGLSPVDDSGYIGVAALHDNGDGTTTVSLYLLTSVPAGAATAVATATLAQPTATAGGGEQAQTSVTLEMVDIAYKPNGFTIPANTDVTITLKNTGVIGHNFSVTDHKNPGLPNLNISQNVPPGQTKTVTVNAPPGDYYFFCNVPGHEQVGMFGTMHVVAQ